MTHVADALQDILDELQDNRDNEISMADEVLSQYITDHNDKSAYRAKDKRVNQLAKTWDRLIVQVAKWQRQAEKIEQSCEEFYGD